MEIDKCQISRTTHVSVPLMLLNSSHLPLKSISVIICLPQSLANQPLSICYVLVTCIVMVSSAFPGKCSVLETTGAYTWISNSSFSLGILPNELKWHWSKCETTNVFFQLSFLLSNWDMLKYVSHSYSTWIFFFQYPSHTTFIIPKSNFILSFISISWQASWNI